MFILSLCLFAMVATSRAGVVLHEVLPDSGSVDANCDGVVGGTDDEFVEIVNLGPGSVSLDGAVLSDGQGARHTFGAGTTLPPGGAVVVFAGGAPAIHAGPEAWCTAPADVGVVVASTGGLSLNNGGDTLTLTRGDGVLLADAAWGDASHDQSLVRDPELTEGALVRHGLVSDWPVSPGLRADGGLLASADPVQPVDTAVGSALAGRVRINELVVDPRGADAGAEWLELVNVDTVAVELGGLQVERAKSAATPWEVVLVLAPRVVAPGEYVVVGEGEDLDLGNSDDAVRLRDPWGGVVDTVVYGGANPDGWADDDEPVATSAAPLPVEAMALARQPDGADTDDCAADFVVAPPTPGASNGAAHDTGDTGVLEPVVRVGAVVINEFLANPEGADLGQEWVELLVVADTPVDVRGWSVERAKSADGYSARFTFPGGVLLPGQRVVVGEAQVDNADHPVSALDLGSGASGDAVRVVDAGGGVIDTVVYGDDNDDGFVDDGGALATSLAPRPGAGAVLGRVPDGHDTDASGVDLRVVSPSPGASNGDLTARCASGLVRINELDPVGGELGEFVELIGRDAAPVPLDGWTLEWGTSSWAEQLGLDGRVLGPGEILVLDAVEGLGNAGRNADAVRLVDCDGAVVDTVVYGAPNDDGWLSDSGDVAVSLAPTPTEGSSLARLDDGHDTDRSGDDFVTAVPTPGRPNRVVAADCAPAAGIVVNEVLADPEGADDGQEWVELYHGGTRPVSLGGWGLSITHASFGTPDVLLPDLLLEPGAFLVIGEQGVGAADHVADLGLGGGSGGDGVRLVDCAGATVDTVVYGDDNRDGVPDDAGLPVTPYGDPAEGASLARRIDGVDTDRAEDWRVALAPTPGAPNALSGGGRVWGRGCGCGAPAPGPRGRLRPAPVCATPGPAWLGLAPWLFAALLSRRRRPAGDRRSPRR